MISFSWIRID